MTQVVMPERLMDKHHKIPQAAGGTDKDLVWLSKGAHQNLHMIAHAILNPKRQHEVEALIKASYPTDHEAQERLAELASLVARYMHQKADSGEFYEGEQKMLQCEVDTDTWQRIFFAAKDRKLSLAAWTKEAVLEKLNKTF